MNLSEFNSTVKHIIATVILALSVFGIIASQSANGTELITKNDEVIKQEALILHIKENYEKAKVILAKAQQEFEQGEISAEEIFFTTVKFHEIEAELLKAKRSYAIHSNRVVCEIERNRNVIGKVAKDKHL